MSTINSLQAWRRILQSFASVERAQFSETWASSLPASVRSQTDGHDVLIPDGHSEVIRCEECSETCLIQPIRDATGTRLIAQCLRAGYGLLQLDLEANRRWTVSPEGLVRWVTDQWKLTTPPVALANRCWRLPSPDPQTVIVFASALRSPGAAETLWKAIALRPHETLYLVVPTRSAVDAALMPLEVNLLPLDEHLLEDPVSSGVRLQLLEVLEPRSRLRPGVVPVDVPPGTPWAAIILRVLDSERTEIVAGDIVSVRTFVELGMADLRQTPMVPTTAWKLLLAFARGQGELAAEKAGGPRARSAPDWSRAQISVLRQALQVAIPATGTPIDEYQRGHGWRTTFTIHRVPKAQK